MGWGRKSYLGPPKMASFSSQDVSQNNKHDIFLEHLFLATPLSDCFFFVVYVKLLS